MQNFTSIDYNDTLCIINHSCPRKTGDRFLLCEYAEAGAVMPHEVFYAVSWHRTASAAHNKRRKQDHTHVVVMY